MIWKFFFGENYFPTTDFRVHNVFPDNDLVDKLLAAPGGAAKWKIAAGAVK